MIKEKFFNFLNLKSFLVLFAVLFSISINFIPKNVFAQSCFLPGTPVQMQDGTTKKIEDVRVGEEVVGYDIQNNQFTKNTVEELEAPVRDEWFKVFLENGRTLRTTDDHPIYVKEHDDWASIDPEATWKNSNYQVKTQQLKAGQHVMDLNEKYSKILFILNIPEKVQTYNFKKVSNNNTFFAENILVHNKDSRRGRTITSTVCGPWSAWSSCTAACDEYGTQTRSRVCRTVTFTSSPPSGGGDGGGPGGGDGGTGGGTGGGAGCGNGPDGPGR